MNHWPYYTLRNFNISHEVRVLCENTTQELPSTVATSTASSYEEGYILCTCLSTSYLATIYAHNLAIYPFASIAAISLSIHSINFKISYSGRMLSVKYEATMSTET